MERGSSGGEGLGGGEGQDGRGWGGGEWRGGTAENKRTLLGRNSQKCMQKPEKDQI